MVAEIVAVFGCLWVGWISWVLWEHHEREVQREYERQQEFDRELRLSKRRVARDRLLTPVQWRKVDETKRR